jgi:hypothetical protein
VFAEDFHLKEFLKNMSQQDYVKKSLISEIEESLLKGAGIRSNTQSDFSCKASETSERDYAIPTPCLRKAMESGFDQSYVVRKVFTLQQTILLPVCSLICFCNCSGKLENLH